MPKWESKLNRDDRIRTCGPFVPNEVRYQAALHPVTLAYYILWTWQHARLEHKTFWSQSPVLALILGIPLLGTCRDPSQPIPLNDPLASCFPPELLPLSRPHLCPDYAQSPRLLRQPLLTKTRP